MEGSTLTRRHAFKLAGLAGAAVALRGATAPAQEAQADRVLPTPKQKPLPQGAGFYRTHVGEIEVTIVSDGAFPIESPHRLFGANASKEAVEAALRDAFLEPTGLMGQVNGLVIRRAGGPVTVVDAGCGKLFGPAAGFFLENLVNSGVKPDDVQNVLFTHLHPDHAGGAVADGRRVFPNAKHWANDEDVKFFTGANPDFSKSGVPAGMRPMMVTAATNVIKATGLEAFVGTKEIVPGVTAMPTGGHTPGHCVLKIEDAGQSLVYVSDLLIQYAIVAAHPEWHVGFDTDLAKTADVRKTLFAELAKNRTRICGSHLPFPSLGHLRTKGDGYEYVPAPWKWA